MFAIPGILGLIIFIYLKPQEFIEPLQRIPFLYLFVALSLFGLAIDVRARHVRIQNLPQLPYVVAFFVWCMITGVAKTGGSGLVTPMIELIISVLLFFVIAMSVQTFRAFEVVTAGVIAASLFVGFVGFHQGFSPLGCAVELGSTENLRADGRPCNAPEDCYGGDAEPGANYQCERQGLFGTMSVGGGRVRYRGVLRDPNELALTTGIAIPLLIGRASHNKSMLRTAMLILGTLMIAVMVAFTQSRGGQIVFASAIGAYFVKKYGWKGIVVAGLCALPLVLLGGRSGQEADSSSQERTEILLEGFEMLKQNPVFGVGYAQFTQHHFLTAHNSYLLPLSENGVLGLFLFLCIVVLSVKIAVSALFRYADRPEARAANVWSMAMVASFTAMSIGIFFLSFTYHQVLWIYLGLTGGLYCSIRRHDPEFEVKLSFWNFVGILMFMAAFAVFLFIYPKIKLGG